MSSICCVECDLRFYVYGVLLRCYELRGGVAATRATTQEALLVPSKAEYCSLSAVCGTGCCRAAVLEMAHELHFFTDPKREKLLTLVSAMPCEVNTMKMYSSTGVSAFQIMTLRVMLCIVRMLLVTLESIISCPCGLVPALCTPITTILYYDFVAKHLQL